MKPLLEALKEATDTAELAYTEPAGPEKYAAGSIQEALVAAELLRLRVLDSLEFSESVRNVGIELQQEEPDTSNNSPIQALRTSRRCLNPAGLHFTNGENTIAPCNKCPECRRWEAMVDAYRALEVIENGVVTYIPEERWQATQKRFQRKGLNYLAKPIEGKRLVVVDGDFEGPVAGPAEGLVSLFLAAEEKRDRSDRRQTSNSAGVRSAKAVKREAFPPKEEEPRQIAGYFSPKLVSHSAVIEEVAEELEKVAQAAKVPYERDGTTVKILVGRHDPRAEWFYQRIGVNWLDSTIPWYQGGPPPNPGDPGWEAWEKAKVAQWHPFSDSPPDWVYDRDAAAIYEEHWVA